MDEWRQGREKKTDSHEERERVSGQIGIVNGFESVKLKIVKFRHS